MSSHVSIHMFRSSLYAMVLMVSSLVLFPSVPKCKDRLETPVDPENVQVRSSQWEPFQTVSSHRINSVD